MTYKIIGTLCAAIALTGCTGTQIKISPEPSQYDQVIYDPYESVGISAIPSERMIPVAGNMTEAFSNELRSIRFAKDIYYPSRPTDNAELMLDAQFNSEIDTHSGAHFVQGFFTGLFMFLIEPFLWYDYDYRLDGGINIIKDGKVIRRVTAHTDATMSAKWLSLSSVGSLERETLTRAKKSLFQQLLTSIGKPR